MLNKNKDKFICRSSEILQINELYEELTKEKKDLGIISKLLYELFEFLNNSITAWTCCEISEFFTFFSCHGLVDNLPDEIKDVFESSKKLGVYPSYSPDLPKKVLNSSKDLLKKYEQKTLRKTKGETIAEMYQSGNNISLIAKKLSLSKGIVISSLGDKGYKINYDREFYDDYDLIRYKGQKDICYSETIPQINIICDDIKKGQFNIDKFCDICVEILENLVNEITSWRICEISKFFSCIYVHKMYRSLPDEVREFIFDAIFLDLYPAPFCHTSPEKLLNWAKELIT